MDQLYLIQRPQLPIEGALFSACRRWRWSLWRIWDPGKNACVFIGLNPSTADETKNDPTVTRCINFARDWGFGGLVMLNAFGWRSTDPRGLDSVEDPVGADNDRVIGENCRRAGLIVAAWGNDKRVGDRGDYLCKQVIRRPVVALQRNKNGSPKHPLYVPGDCRPALFFTP